MDGTATLVEVDRAWLIAMSSSLLEMTTGKLGMSRDMTVN